jgi:predicted ArsR family transcriptional regulator
VDEIEIRRAIHARYKAKTAEARELTRENGQLKERIRWLESVIEEQGYIVKLAEQVLGLES